MAPSLIKFGLYELNTGSRRLHKQGRRVRLQEQPLRILEILLQRPGELVTREELTKQLWPSGVHVDFDLGLNGAIKRLRLALDDSAENPIFVETVPKQGYRFIAPVQRAPVAPQSVIHAPEIDSSREVSEILAKRAAEEIASSSKVTPRVQHRKLSRALQILAAIVVIAILLVAVDLIRPVTSALRVTRIVKLSNSGHAWSPGNLLSDGS